MYPIKAHAMDNPEEFAAGDATFGGREADDEGNVVGAPLAGKAVSLTGVGVMGAIDDADFIGALLGGRDVLLKSVGVMGEIAGASVFGSFGSSCPWTSNAAVAAAAATIRRTAIVPTM